MKRIETDHEALAEELVKCKSQHRRRERDWLAEKETLYRKLQLMQQLGSVVSSSAAEEGGFFTDQRAAGRLAAEGKLKKQVQKLNVRGY